MKNIKHSILFMSFLLMAPLSQAFLSQTDDPGHTGWHLSFRGGSLHIHANFENPPAVGSESTMILRAMDPATHQTIEISDRIKVILWMPSMGHGSSPTRVEPLADGTYRVRNMYFVMGGDWEVRVQLTDLSGKTETQAFAFDLSDGQTGMGPGAGGGMGHRHRRGCK